jgi:hypothetical protein
MSHLPRNGRYELFTYAGRTRCFDDPDDFCVNVSPEMFEWLRAQPAEMCRPMDNSNTAFYLTPEMYLVWKLKWA